MTREKGKALDDNRNLESYMGAYSNKKVKMVPGSSNIELDRDVKSPIETRQKSRMYVQSSMQLETVGNSQDGEGIRMKQSRSEMKRSS